MDEKFPTFVNSTFPLISHLVKRNENVSFKFWEISTKQIQKFADKFPNFYQQEVGVKNATRWYQINIYKMKSNLFALFYLYTYGCLTNKVNSDILWFASFIWFEMLPNFICCKYVSLFPHCKYIWMLFCIQSVWSDSVFWKQIKLIPKCTSPTNISN